MPQRMRQVAARSWRLLMSVRMMVAASAHDKVLAGSAFDRPSCVGVPAGGSAALCQRMGSLWYMRCHCGQCVVLAMPRVSRGHGVELIRAAVVVLVVVMLLLVMLLWCRCFGLLRTLGEGRGALEAGVLGNGCVWGAVSQAEVHPLCNITEGMRAPQRLTSAPSPPQGPPKCRTDIGQRYVASHPEEQGNAPGQRTHPSCPTRAQQWERGLGATGRALHGGGDGQWPSSPRCDRRELLATRQVVLASA